jgi:hypothetical protein
MWTPDGPNFKYLYYTEPFWHEKKFPCSVISRFQCMFKQALLQDIYNRTWLKRRRFTRHLIYNVRYFVVPINSSLLTITLYFSVITTLVYNVTRL